MGGFVTPVSAGPSDRMLRAFFVHWVFPMAAASSCDGGLSLYYPGVSDRGGVGLLGRRRADLSRLELSCAEFWPEQWPGVASCRVGAVAILCAFRWFGFPSVSRHYWPVRVTVRMKQALVTRGPAGVAVLAPVRRRAGRRFPDLDADLAIVVQVGGRWLPPGP